MKHALLIIFFILSGNLLSQTLEDRIYSATEAFNATRTPEALSELDLEINAFEAELQTKDDYLAFINLLINKAYYLERTLDYQLAISNYEKAWALYKSKKISTVFKYDIIEHCLIKLGILYHKTNNYTNAENTIKYYISLAKKQNNKKQQAIGAVNLANLYQKLGKHTLALEVANNGLNIAAQDAIEQKRLKQIKKNSLAALKENRVAMCGTTSPAQEFRFKDHQLAYTAAIEEGDYENALKLFRSLIQYWQNDLSSTRELAKLKHEEANLYYLLNRQEDANKSLQQALTVLIPNYDKNSLPKTHDVYPENTFIEIFDALASLQEKPEIALHYYDLSFYVSDLLTEQITSQEAKIIEIASNRKRSEKCIALLHQLQLKSDNSNYIKRAFQYAENSKASLLQESHSKKDLLKRHPNDTLLLKEQHLLRVQYQLTNRLIKTPYKPTNTDKTSTLRDSLNSINIVLRSLQKNIKSKYNLNATNNINYKLLQQRLTKNDAALIAYFYGEKAIYQFVFTNTTLALTAIKNNPQSSRAISGFIGLFNDASVINNDVSAFTKQAYETFKTLQLEGLQHKKNIIIIPDGLLNFIPFEALLTAKTETLNFNKMPFMVKRHAVVYNSSAFLYLKNKSNEYKNDKHDNNLLGIFPVFEDTTQELKFTINEAKSIANEVDSKFLMYTSATKESFLKHASQFNILHLSTHASSGNFITPAHIEFSNQTLYLNELYALNLTPKLVVLSACETGVGKLIKGEGPMSLARGFNYAGAENILFSLWQISDASTAKIMKLFYKDYSKRGSASYANRKSKLHYLNDKNISSIKKSPYYWSAFVYYGSFESPKQNTLTYVIITVFSILFVVLLLSLFKQWYEKRSQRISS